MRGIAVAFVCLSIGLTMAERSAAVYQGPHTAAAFEDASYNLDYDPPAQAGANDFDLYLPKGVKGLRPVVVWVHGGGWAIGDKANKIPRKVDLLNGAGYLLVSLNYQLSPSSPPLDLALWDPMRIRFPEHSFDIAEALAWIDREIRFYGGDPDRIILMGHSAGAHLALLAGTNPAWMKAYGASMRQVLGTVSLDAGAIDVAEAAAGLGSDPTGNQRVIWNAFGTPAEEMADPRWQEASPLHWGDPSDPRALLVTQLSNPNRIVRNEAMATAMGQDPAGVLKVPLNHEGINDAVGDPGDATGETAAIMSFIANRLATRIDPSVRITRRPAKRTRTGRARSGKPKQRRVTFAFKASGDRSGVQCRIDKAAWKLCKSPRRYVLKTGRHTFRVRPLYPSGRPGNERKASFRIVARRNR